MSVGKRVVEGEMRWSSKLYSSRGCCEANMVGEVVVGVNGGEGVWVCCMRRRVCYAMQ
jgi:hypothetical protein